MSSVPPHPPGGQSQPGPSGSSGPRRQTFQAPKGTRDFYPQDLFRRRYIEKMWRDTSIRHGFEEIDGPTFETVGLYKAKSGEGILGEMFGVFSGKAEEDLKALRESGEAPYALRPEFTPTLARMYAARAAQLPKPSKWFWQQNCFRAEKPQKGRLREFGQWNIDLIGDSSPAADAEAIGCAVGLLAAAGLRPEDVRVRFNHRRVLSELVARLGVDDEHMGSAFVLLDRRDRLADADLDAMAFEFGLTGGDFIAFLKRPRGKSDLKDLLEWVPQGSASSNLDLAATLRAADEEVRDAGAAPWCDLDLGIVRGLAYYTGMVFEVHEASGALRAIAGGGRYDNLIETFGGPPTPAVGFGMGDVVLSLALQDRGLMPEGKDLLDALSRPAASLRPDVFVIANDKDESQALLRPLVARLRRGGESRRWLDRADRKPWNDDRYAPADDSDKAAFAPLHVRHSYKATRNIGKLLQDASAQHARFAAIIESAETVTLKDLDAGSQITLPVGDMATAVRRVCP